MKKKTKCGICEGTGIVRTKCGECNGYGYLIGIEDKKTQPQQDLFPSEELCRLANESIGQQKITNEILDLIYKTLSNSKHTGIDA